MKLIIAGDISLQHRATGVKWEEGQLAKSFSDVRNIVQECDHSIVNLESPITKSQRSILKDGPTLKNKPIVFDLLKYCGFDCLTLANNHLKDYGAIGVIDTIEQCREQGFMTVGAGVNIEKARRTLVLKDRQISLGIINVCEHESSIAGRNTAGTNPFDFSYLFYDITHLRQQVDKVIVIIHGGREHYQLPTPRMKREYRLIIDMGADIIVNHHQHCYSGYELYNGKPIFYGIGNYFFDNPAKRNDKWNYGLLLRLNIEKDSIDYQLVPFEQCNEDVVVNILSETTIQQKIDELNSIIVEDIRLENEYDKLVENSKPFYPFLPYGNHYLRALYLRGFLKDFISNKNKALIENVVSCETLRELLLHYLNKKLHNDD